MDIFCKIINNEIPSYTIYEDEIVKVFLDVNPNHIGHTLIVPKKHYQDFFDIDKRIDTTYEIVIGYYNLWYEEAEVYHYESMFSEPKLIGKITRSEYVELMDCIHKKMV
jgi:hypothetical protein